MTEIRKAGRHQGFAIGRGGAGQRTNLFLSDLRRRASALVIRTRVEGPGESEGEVEAEAAP